MSFMTLSIASKQDNSLSKLSTHLNKCFPWKGRFLSKLISMADILRHHPFWFFPVSIACGDCGLSAIWTQLPSWNPKTRTFRGRDLLSADVAEFKCMILKKTSARSQREGYATTPPLFSPHRLRHELSLPYIDCPPPKRLGPMINCTGGVVEFVKGTGGQVEMIRTKRCECITQKCCAIGLGMHQGVLASRVRGAKTNTYTCFSGSSANPRTGFAFRSHSRGRFFSRLCAAKTPYCLSVLRRLQS